MNPLLCVSIFALTLASYAGLAQQKEIEGRWLSGDGDGWIEIRLIADTLTGVAAGSTTAKKGDPPRLDDKNPDPDLRNRPIEGMTIMSGFQYAGDGRWTGGKIYDPNSGKTYKATVTLVDNDTLKLRGYIGVSLFGRTDTWTRDEE